MGSNGETVFRLKGERAFEVDVWTFNRRCRLLGVIARFVRRITPAPVGDVEPATSIPGALTIRVRTSKTNRDGEATDVRLAKNGAAAALTALRPANAAPEALVFRGLNGQSIGRRFAAAANAAGSKASPPTQAGLGSPAN